MRACFDEVKMTQAAAFFLRLAPDHKYRKYRKLVRLMYLADRESLTQLGYSITKGKHYSLPQGPVVSEVNDLLTGNHSAEALTTGYWGKHILCDKQNGVRMIRDPGTGRLGASHIRILERIANEFGTMTDDELGEVTHALPEYRYPGAGGRIPIAATTILGLGNFAVEQVEGIVQENEALDFLRQLSRQ